MLTRDEIAEKLIGMISEHRYIHSLGVEQTAAHLAALYGADEAKCIIAGLAHDCAKSLSTDEQLAAVSRGGIVLYDGEERIGDVLHAPAGAVIAKEAFGIEDPDILSAIRYHTIGNEHMTLIEAIIYVADYIEPNRREHDGLQKVRDLAETDIYAAAAQARICTEEYCRSIGAEPFVFSKTSQTDA